MACDIIELVDYETIILHFNFYVRSVCVISQYCCTNINYYIFFYCEHLNKGHLLRKYTG